jgi:hypothetical protein
VQYRANRQIVPPIFNGDRQDEQHPQEHVRRQQQSNPKDGHALGGQEDQQHRGGRGGRPTRQCPWS